MYFIIWHLFTIFSCFGEKYILYSYKFVFVVAFVEYKKADKEVKKRRNSFELYIIYDSKKYYLRTLIQVYIIALLKYITICLLSFMLWCFMLHLFML